MPFEVVRRPKVLDHRALIVETDQTMCLLCGAPTHDIALTERPAQRLGGYAMEVAAAGEADARETLVGRIADWSRERSSPWRSPVVTLAWHGGDGVTRLFAGEALEAEEAAPAEGTLIALPEMTLVSSWHDGSGEGAAAHYGRMLEWLGTRGIARTRAHFDHREEYPAGAATASGPMRLLLAVEAGGPLLL